MFSALKFFFSFFGIKFLQKFDFHFYFCSKNLNSAQLNKPLNLTEITNYLTTNKVITLNKIFAIN